MSQQSDQETVEWDKSFIISQGLAEDIVWSDEINPLLEDMSEKAMDI